LVNEREEKDGGYVNDLDAFALSQSPATGEAIFSYSPRHFFAVGVGADFA